MIIDAHAHTNGGNLGNYKAGLLASRPWPAPSSIRTKTSCAPPSTTT